MGRHDGDKNPELVLVMSPKSNNPNTRKAKFSGFPPEAFAFLRDLKKNNNREWFQENKIIYDTKVRAPMVQLIEALQPEMKEFAPELEVNSRAIFRIYRDIRFSQNKSPYKTHIAASFDLKGPRAASAGLYLHVEPGKVFLGGGVYHPDSAQLLAIRTHIAAEHRKLRKMIQDSQFKRLFGKLDGEKLARMPRGFSEDHPAADLLKFKQVLVWKELNEAIARSPELQKQALKYFRGMMPVIRFLNTALKKAPTKSWG
jgi:uncharacterized protein (TIGR02453 family)